MSKEEELLLEELSNEFDLKLNSFDDSPVHVELNEYEKSVYLTDALYDVVYGLYRGLVTGEPFEKTEDTKTFINNLIKGIKIEGCCLDCLDGNDVGIHNKYFNNKKVNYPDNVFFIIEESALIENYKCGSFNTFVDVIPIQNDDYLRIRNNPFKQPSDRKILRIDGCNTNGSRTSVLISKYPIVEYNYRYIELPDPIILVDLTASGLSIKGKQTKSICKLNTFIYKLILEKAVKSALENKLAGLAAMQQAQQQAQPQQEQ